MLQSGSQDAQIVALRALTYILTEEKRAARFLSLTGYGVDDLRQAADSPQVQQAVFAFLAGYEPDLLGCAEELDMTPEELAAYAQPDRAEI
ncbi:hypothetical protein B5C34_07290 [Pacificimonas flava]|uniref:DUF3572 domain-containing protein n=3 Tax=Sphingosinicellaceae TaxID=2820280 RepID=A0A219B518_9SPHN|nr:DUF3572 family protein [Pacificimonas aurantium]OWV33284.1 hypothetical protein B5C34_07290 [Pacificimonas flava]